MGEIYRGEVYDEGGHGVNFRLEPEGRKRTFETDWDFRLGENGDPSKLAGVARKIYEGGGSIVFPSTQEIRGAFDGCSGVPRSQINCMRGFTNEEQQKVLAGVS